MAAPRELTKLPLGPSGMTVASNIKRLMESQNLTFVALADKLDKIKRPIPTLGLRKIIKNTRRVDADDLVALAVALGVSPITLLTPDASEPTDAAEVTGVSGSLTAKELWDWLRAYRPLPTDGDLGASQLLDFIGAAAPGWRRKQYAEGVLALLEAKQLENEVALGGSRAEAALSRVSEILES